MCRSTKEWGHVIWFPTECDVESLWILRRGIPSPPSQIGLRALWILSSLRDFAHSGVFVVAAMMVVVMTVVGFLCLLSTRGRLMFSKGTVRSPQSLVFRCSPRHNWWRRCCRLRAYRCCDWTMHYEWGGLTLPSWRSKVFSATVGSVGSVDHTGAPAGWLCVLENAGVVLRVLSRFFVLV